MTIQPIGSGSAALYITPHGPEGAGADAEGPDAGAGTGADPRRLPSGGSGVGRRYRDRGLPGILRRAGICPYPVNGTGLAFLWMPGGADCGARTLPPPLPDGALLWWRGRWWLSLPAGAEQAAARLSEFGRCESHRPHLEASLVEHGQMIFPADAVNGLLTYFPV